MSNKVWCPEVYRGLYVDRVNDTHLRVAPCCQAQGRTEPLESFTFETSTHLNQIRQAFDRGERPPECHRCWELEDVGQRSRRQGVIEFFNLPEPDTTIQLESLDHSVTWACNLGCIMCNPRDSSFLAQELDFDRDRLYQLGRLFQKSNRWFEQVDLSKVKKVHINGGEPFLNTDQDRLLEYLDKPGVLNQTQISYNTNGTQYPSNKIVDIWSRARLVKIFFSIDATGPAYDYIRYGADWEKTASNILRMRSELPSNVMFGFNVTVGNYNLFELADVVDWFKSNLLTNREGDPSDFCWQLTYDGLYDIRDLVEPAKQAAIAELSTVPELQGIVERIKSTLNYTADNQWISKLEIFDRRRNTCWKTALKIGQYY